MGCVQFMCARIGMVTGRGLAGTLRLKFPKQLIAVATFALFIANTINIGADLSGMADCGEMLTGLQSLWFVPLFGIAITAASIWCRYKQIARILKWLALALMAYVVTGFMINPDWSQVLWSTIIPTLPKSHAMWGHARSDPRHHDQSVSLLLAKFAGSGGGEIQRAQKDRR